MAVHILKRILYMIPILLLVSIILFTIMEILPGDAATGMMSADMQDEYLEALREKLGLNRPVYIRYLEWVSGMLRGDFGKSLLTNTPVSKKIMIRLPVTIEITFLAMLTSIIIAVPLGIISVIKRNSFLDVLASTSAMVGVTMPHFWMGMLLILLFSITLKCLPASGYVPITKDPLGNLRGMILPAISIGISFAATVMRQTRSALLDILDQDYIVTAKAKGLKKSVVIWKHALRNSLIPVITVIAMQTGRLLGGAAVSETVFALPGIGKELVDAILSRDTPVVMGLIMTIAVIVVLINTLVDVIYIIVDPRISHTVKR